MFAEDMNDLQLTFLDDDVQRVRIELDSFRILHIVIDEKTVRQSRSELEADFTTKSQLESFDGVAVDLDERVVLRKHKFLLRLFLFSLLEDQLVALRVSRLNRVLRLIGFDICHIFAG